MVNGPAPWIAEVKPTGGNVMIAGANLSADTRILFDGLPAAVTGVTDDGKLLVTPPPAPGGYTATVVALNPDGQSSLMITPTPVTFTYDGAAGPSLNVSPILLPPAVDTVVDIQGVNTNFVQDQTTVGFGTSDIVVSNVTVLSPTHMTAVVTPSAFAFTSGVTVTNGLRVMSQSLATPITFTDQPPQQ